MPPVSRRRLLAAAAGLAGATAGCAGRSGPALTEATGDVPTVERPVAVSDDYFAAARRRDRDAVGALESTLANTRIREGMLDDMTTAEDPRAALREAEDLGPTWAAIELLRGDTVEAAAQTAYLRAWNGTLSRTDVSERVGGLEPPSREGVAYDRGSAGQCLLQAATAEQRVQAGRRAGERAADALERVDYASVDAVPGRRPTPTGGGGAGETPTPVVDGTSPASNAEMEFSTPAGDIAGDEFSDRVNDRLAWPASVAVGEAVAAETSHADVAFIGASLERTRDYRGAFERVYDRLRSEGSPGASPEYYGRSFQDLADWNTPHGSRREADYHAEQGFPATALLRLLEARLLVACQEALGAAEAERPLESLDSEAVVAAGERAHEKFAWAAVTTSDPVATSLLALGADPLRQADRAVRGVNSGPFSSPSSDQLAPAYARYRFVLAVVEHAPRVADRFRELVGSG